jgi:hypothetical protein
MLAKSVGVAAQAPSHTPAVPVLKGANRASPQKHCWRTLAAAVAVAQAPLTSYRGPHAVAQAGNDCVGKTVVTGAAILNDYVRLDG